MKAIVQDVYGPADVLELRDIDRPVPGPDEVLIRVRAAGAGPDVWHLDDRPALSGAPRLRAAQAEEPRARLGRRGGGSRRSAPA
ncbi:hypothetical protein ACRAWF_19060 [Streptomyces sp. L7]